MMHAFGERQSELAQEMLAIPRATMKPGTMLGRLIITLVVPRSFRP